MAEEVFGEWMEEPDGPGVYHFKGYRELPIKNGQVRTNDIVEVIEHKHVKGFKLLSVLFLGRGQKFSIDLFHGKWRKATINFSGERRK